MTSEDTPIAEMAVVPTNNDDDVEEADGSELAVVRNGDFTEVAKLGTVHDPFSTYLKSEPIKVTVGTDEAAETINVHRLLLEQSPYFRDLFESEPESDTRLSLPNEDPQAFQSLVEYLYKGEYFPRRRQEDGLDELEKDDSLPEIDDTGEELLKHARIYLLAEKFSLEDLKELSFAKVHLVASMPIAELVYARFVYEHTSSDNIAMRLPVATFWAQKSHVVRHAIEEEFKKMCLDFPQFGFDVLNLVLDQKESRKLREKEKDKDSHSTREDSVRSSARKRPRHSGLY